MSVTSLWQVWTQWVWPLLQFVIGLGIVVFVHELGHFIAAKWSGIKVEEFALGFGKRLWAYRRGETEYRINLVPLGGYVKMLGQDDLNPGLEVRDDARSWQCASARKKMLVLAAGVFMNILFAIGAFIVIYMVGIRFQAPVVGSVEPEFPAYAAGLQPGDTIVAINGKPIRKFSQIIMKAALSSKDQEFAFTIGRDVGGREKTFTVNMTPKKTEEGKVGPQYAFGLIPAASTTIEVPGKTGYVGAEQFQSGDTIVSIGDTPIQHSWQMDAVLPEYAGKPVSVVVDRRGQKVTVQTNPPDIHNLGGQKSQELLNILGMSCLIKVEAVTAGTSADRAGLKSGDLIVSYGDIEKPSRPELMAKSEQSADRPTPIAVLRDGKTLSLLVTPERRDGQVLIGIVVGPAQNLPLVAAVADGSPAAKAGLSKGALIKAIDGTAVSSWSGVYGALAPLQGKSAKVTFTLNGQDQTGTLDVPEGSLDPKAYAFDLQPAEGVLRELKTEPVHGDPLKAIVWSAEDTWDWMLQSYQTLARIFEGRVSAKEVSGPVGIGQIAVATARKSPVDFAYFIAMLSAMLAVFNFLPWPALDGGHFVIVLVEKARGKPLSSRVMTAIQLVGISVLMCVFLAVTFNDILRLIRK